MKLLSGLRSRIRRLPRVAGPVYRGWRSRRDLRAVLDRTQRIGRSDILLFATLRNEAWRIPYFLHYYRKLGVKHFLFVDNGSTDGFMDIMQEQEDCSVWHTEASYKGSNFGMHWLNHLLRIHGTGHWCVTCDPDELLVYPHCEERTLQDLAEFLRGENTDHLFCLLIDMYGEGQWFEAACRPGQDPLAVTAYFDSSGYVQSPDIFWGGVFVQGGVRRRHFFRHSPSGAPALNKTPFVLWKQHYAYVSSMHLLNLKRLNRPHKAGHVSPTGCLLHFKLQSGLLDKAREEVDRKQHYGNSVEYKAYLEAGGSKASLMCDISRRYEGSRTLVNLGLMSPGQWF
jgi:hypothetical protein